MSQEHLGDTRTLRYLENSDSKACKQNMAIKSGHCVRGIGQPTVSERLQCKKRARKMNHMPGLGKYKYVFGSTPYLSTRGSTCTLLKYFVEYLVLA